ncbi:MAG: alkaline phosphatase family protein [Myxococcota bacterium]|nr:alkaline phosphatase family protein [Myxococcota bacterium]
MNTIRRLAQSGLLGAGIGLTWWALYVPLSQPLGILVTGHALLVLLIQGCLLLVGWRSFASLLMASMLGLLVAPTYIALLERSDVLLGKEGFALSIVLSVVLVAGGALVGRGLRRPGPARVVAGGMLLVVIMACSAASLLLEPPAVDAPAPNAAKITESFPSQSVAVFGIDGGDWQVMEPLMEQGLLPNLLALRDAGRHGVLRSMDPMFSPVIWTTIFSGRSPENHGLVDWFRSDNRNRRVPMLWDIFGAHGRSSLTVGVPGTWPPSRVKNGKLFAGLPIPGLTNGSASQLSGLVVSSRKGDTGFVETIQATRLEDGRFAMDLPFAAQTVSPRFSGISHGMLDTFVRKEYYGLRRHRLEATATVASDGSVTVEGPALVEGALHIPSSGWSEWTRFDNGKLQAIAQAHRIPGEEDELRLYFTPAFQAPDAPRFPFATGLDVATYFRDREPYIVEGLGWRVHRDDRIAAYLPETLMTVEQGHAAVVLDEIRAELPQLVSYPITVTDRIQHPFWRDHQPEPFGSDWSPHPGLEGRDPVVEAYLLADTIIGEVLALMPEDVLVLVTSDHGATPEVAKGEGGHRSEGIWIARGPMVPHDAEPREMGVQDVVPTLLHCIGAPVAEDFDGRPAEELCPGVKSPIVLSYRLDGDEPPMVRPVEIDSTREEQLRALGYLDE